MTSVLERGHHDTPVFPNDTRRRVGSQCESGGWTGSRKYQTTATIERSVAMAATAAGIRSPSTASTKRMHTRTSGSGRADPGSCETTSPCRRTSYGSWAAETKSNNSSDLAARSRAWHVQDPMAIHEICCHPSVPQYRRWGARCGHGRSKWPSQVASSDMAGTPFNMRLTVRRVALTLRTTVEFAAVIPRTQPSPPRTPRVAQRSIAAAVQAIVGSPDSSGSQLMLLPTPRSLPRRCVLIFESSSAEAKSNRTKSPSGCRRWSRHLTSSKAPSGNPSPSATATNAQPGPTR